MREGVNVTMAATARQLLQPRRSEIRPRDVAPSFVESAPAPCRRSAMSNLKLALRTLRRTPFITTVAVLSLAQGIGANAAIYTIMDRILVASLPVQEPTRLVNLSAPGPKPGSQSCTNAGDCDVVF